MDNALTMLIEVLDEVLLALELVGQLLPIHVAEGALLGLDDFLGFHGDW